MIKINYLHKAFGGGKGFKKYKMVNPFGIQSETKDIIKYANNNGYALPSDINPLNDLILNLKISNIWQKLDVFYIFCGNGSNGFKLINLINPNLHYPTALGGLTWDIDGVKGNGSNANIITYNPSIDGVNYTLTNAGRFCVNCEFETSGASTVIDGVIAGANNIMGAANGTWFRINSGTTSLNSNADLSGDGFTGIFRTSNTNVHLVKLNNNFDRTQNVSAIVNNSQRILMGNSSYSRLKLSCYGMGGALTYTETQTFRTHYNNFLTSLSLTPVA